MVADCDFVRADDRITCRECGFSMAWTIADHVPRRNCGNAPALAVDVPPPIAPTFFRKLANFAKAAMSQAPLFVEAAMTGDESLAVRSREEIAANYEICKACEFFDADSKACGHHLCGCMIDPARSAFWSALAWKSHVCPDSPPRWK